MNEKKLIFSIILSLAFSSQTVKADPIFCPQQLLCNKNIHNNLVCSTNVKTNFENWIVFQASTTYGPVKYIFSGAQVNQDGRDPMCFYSSVGISYGSTVVIMSFNRYYPSGSNWTPIQLKAADIPTILQCPPDISDKYIPTQTCPFSTTK